MNLCFVEGLGETGKAVKFSRGDSEETEEQLNFSRNTQVGSGLGH